MYIYIYIDIITKIFIKYYIKIYNFSVSSGTALNKSATKP